MAQQITITVHVSSERVKKLIRQLPQILSGDGAIKSPEGRRLLVRLGLVTQRVLWMAFMNKTLGNADASGLRWPKLSPLTIKKKKQTAPNNAYMILRELDWLDRSLEPALPPESAAATPPGVPLQVFRLLPGQVVLGTSRPFALLNHEGDPEQNLPQ